MTPTEQILDWTWHVLLICGSGVTAAVLVMRWGTGRR